MITMYITMKNMADIWIVSNALHYQGILFQYIIHFKRCIEQFFYKFSFYKIWLMYDLIVVG